MEPGAVDEWVAEARERPQSAEAMLRLIAQRLQQLSEENEQLRDENILLRSGKRVAELESRIATLEYQLQTLQRQFSGVSPVSGAASAALAYTPDGRVWRCDLPDEGGEAGQILARLPAELSASLCVTATSEELLLLFDSGRVLTLPLQDLPTQGSQWQAEARGEEKLVCILPIGRLSLFRLAVQVSRRAAVRAARTTYLANWIGRGNVGTGVLSSLDRTCAMTLCADDERLVIVSQQGVFWNIAAGALPYSPQEALRLAINDQIICAFPMQHKPFVLALTQNGKVFHRPADWLEAAHSMGSQGQAVLSPTRLQAGLRIVFAGAVSETDAGLTLEQSGDLCLMPVREWLDRGALADKNLVAAAVFTPGQ